MDWMGGGVWKKERSQWYCQHPLVGWDTMGKLFIESAIKTWIITIRVLRLCLLYFPKLHSNCIFLLITSFLFHLQRQHLSLQTSGTLPLAISQLWATQYFLPLAQSPTAQVHPKPGQQPTPLWLGTCEPLLIISCAVPSATLTFTKFLKSFPISGSLHLTLQILRFATLHNHVSQLLINKSLHIWMYSI